MSYFRIALITLFFSLISVANAHTFDAEGFLGDKMQVKLEPKYSSGNLIGIDIYELWPDAEIGHAVIAKRSYYRFDTQQAIEDREWYHAAGFLSDSVIEIEHKYESQNWSITADLAAKLDRAAKLVADPKPSIEDLRKVYEAFRVSPFSVKAGQKDREGERRFKWLAGQQIIGEAEFGLTRSPKYGNRFVAKFHN